MNCGALCSCVRKEAVIETLTVEVVDVHWGRIAAGVTVQLQLQRNRAAISIIKYAYCIRSTWHFCSLRDIIA